MQSSKTSVKPRGATGDGTADKSAHNVDNDGTKTKPNTASLKTKEGGEAQATPSTTLATAAEFAAAGLTNIIKGGKVVAFGALAAACAVFPNSWNVIM